MSAEPGQTPGPAPGQTPGPDTVFFLSDYGRSDEFVGVVHAVLRRLAPQARVIDLTHDVPPFDVRAGAAALARAVPYLGDGVVLGVVDPGVGGGRRPVAIEVAPAGGEGPRWFVGPDNGLFPPAVAELGVVTRAMAIGPPPGADALGPVGSLTFDGRDVFAPATAALCNGTPPDRLGRPVDPADLVLVPGPVLEYATLPNGRRAVRAEVTWVDRFGNVQLAASGSALPDALPRVGVAVLAVVPHGVGPVLEVRRVGTFGDLELGEAGLLVDANGRLALVVREGSASARFGIGPGALLELAW